MGERGSSLIEILVALLVISVGLLGVAGMLAYTVKGSQSSYLRSQATFLAYELTDAMRSAPDDARAGLFDDGCADAGVACSFRQGWNARVVDWLGDGAAGAVSWDDDRLTVRLTWNDYRGEVVDDQGNDSTSIDSVNQTFEFETEI
ncbi:Type IV fimbrial biogenesis protein PilV [Marinobacterium lacunae]|uniref:Type IV fimbrial biogenesis protein PilV n=1 Tax=Marinobacterium lacunae TaxID=1232683 RepID=A0A081G1D3_9GAMM|nr:type IV pilus modification protein PilV [Marinobacterium lacunae]KEA64588.1 Type IV fimbrial biogenesis protein PilV [Marinobacterium lacunae]MBR9883213.1 type IV pilus modification protein PilV [Oceanospirillales bacterium]